MDYVYICRSGANEELRYSIRSIVKNLNAKTVWIVGNKPDWYTGNFIEVKDAGNKFENITKCYEVISQSNSISEDFILMNDDFFVMMPTAMIPVVYNGTLSEKIESHIEEQGPTAYSRVLKNANIYLKNNKIKNALNYDVHFPMQINRNLLSKIDLSIYAPRSVYGNTYSIGGDQMKDVKVYASSGDIYLGNHQFLSTEDKSFKKLLPQMKQFFPDPSPYESTTESDSH